MTKKTRIRIARIAAGAVVAAGASLTAAGVASATESDCTLGILCASDTAPGPGDPSGPAGPTDPTSELPGDPSATATDEPTDPTEIPTEPTEDPTEPTEAPTTAQPTQGGGHHGNGTGGGNGSGHHSNGNGGGNNTNPDGGSGTSAQEQGTSALTDTGSDTTPSGTQAQPQGGGDQLAETGAGQTAFLVIGAATMIAGGIGFRVLPRLAGGRGGAAA